MPSPKILEPPHNLNATVGSTAVFTCDFKAVTNTEVAQIYWEFNATDLAGCSRFKDRTSCKIVQQSNGTNYISSTLTINPVQADNAGQYTCYCSYNTSLLNVDGVQVIESDHKSATLSVQSGNEIVGQDQRFHIIIITVSVGVFIIIIALLIVLKLIHYKFHLKKYTDQSILELSNLLEDGK